MVSTGKPWSLNSLCLKTSRWQEKGIPFLSLWIPCMNREICFYFFSCNSFSILICAALQKFKTESTLLWRRWQTNKHKVTQKKSEGCDGSTGTYMYADIFTKNENKPICFSWRIEYICFSSCSICLWICLWGKMLLGVSLNSNQICIFFIITAFLRLFMRALVLFDAGYKNTELESSPELQHILLLHKFIPL